MAVPEPTPILRLVHYDNLRIYLQRGGIHAPNFEPSDGLNYHVIHDIKVQQKRRQKRVSCGPDGVGHDYVPFYFGYLSPMLLNLKTGSVAGYGEGQEPLIYLVSTCQAVRDSGAKFVFTDGHALATFTSWFEDLKHLDKVDWAIVNERYWSDTVNHDMDRQRRKQAEFLVYRFCDWSLIHKIAVISDRMRASVMEILAGFPHQREPEVVVERGWYYR